MAFKTIKMDDGSVLEPDEYAEDFSKVVKHKKVEAAVAVVKLKRVMQLSPRPRVVITSPSAIKESKKEILRLHSEIGESLRTSVDKAIRIGELLNSIKENLHHGQWENWVADNLGNVMSQRSATRYMALAELASERSGRCWIKKDKLADLTLFDAYKLLPHKLRGDPKPEVEPLPVRLQPSIPKVEPEVGSDHELIQPEAEVIEPEVVD